MVFSVFHSSGGPRKINIRKAKKNYKCTILMVSTSLLAVKPVKIR
jgi:hypothetical protein